MKQGMGTIYFRYLCFSEGLGRTVCFIYFVFATGLDGDKYNFATSPRRVSIAKAKRIKLESKQSLWSDQMTGQGLANAAGRSTKGPAFPALHTQTFGTSQDFLYDPASTLISLLARTILRLSSTDSSHALPLSRHQHDEHPSPRGDI